MDVVNIYNLTTSQCLRQREMVASGANLEAAASDVVEDDLKEDEEDFMVWKKNTPFLYDFVISHALVWPSLTVQFLPNDPVSSSSSPSSIILGTHTSDNDLNYLMLATVQTSSDLTSNPSVQITQKIPHQGEVNRARYMPQKPTVIATKTCGADVHLFDCGDEGIREECSGPDAILKGHGEEGYGLSWSRMKEGILLSGSYDGSICLWDLGGDIIKDGLLNARDVFEVFNDCSTLEVLALDFGWCYVSSVLCDLFRHMGMPWRMFLGTPKMRICLAQ